LIIISNTGIVENEDSHTRLFEINLTNTMISLFILIIRGWQKKDNWQIFSTNKVHIRKRPVSANLREIQLVDLNILLEIFAP
jgi:hypothetical protein